MPIAELVRMERTLDSSGHSPVSDDAARRWGYGRPTFLRSSANHVFVCRAMDPATEEAVLRMKPASPQDHDAAEVVAVLARGLAAAGVHVAAAKPSIATRLVEVFDDDRQAYLATAYRYVSGDPVDASGLDQARAEAWGSLLASLHGVAGRVAVGWDVRLPSWDEDRFTEAVAFFADDSLKRLVDRTRTELARLSHDPQVFGVVHGDPELDNVVWSGKDPVLVDLDDATCSWFLADVVFALRDFAPLAGPPDPDDPIVEGFIRGYRRVRSLTDEELLWMPLMARAHAMVTLARLQPVLAHPTEGDWPDWAHQLDARVRAKARELETVLLAMGG
jgi:Ser/Thr protein kinase RdoA (MazF antagonist)